MTAPRSAEQVHDEQVSEVAQAISTAEAASTRQQGDAGRWLDAGVPADPSVTQPGPVLG